jgi:SHS2 domain-containing protein
MQGREAESIRWLEHDADMLLEVRAPTEERLFALAAEALARLMLEGELPPETELRSVRALADDPESLLVAWLNEVVYLVTGRVFFPARVRTVRLSGGTITAELAGVPGDAGFPPLSREVKAAAFHALELAEEAGSWRCLVLFDV